MVKTINIVKVKYFVITFNLHVLKDGSRINCNCFDFNVIRLTLDGCLEFLPSGYSNCTA